MILIYVISQRLTPERKHPRNGGMRVAEGKFRISFSRERARAWGNRTGSPSLDLHEPLTYCLDDFLLASPLPKLLPF